MLHRARSHSPNRAARATRTAAAAVAPTARPLLAEVPAPRAAPTRTTTVVHPWHGIEPGSAALIHGTGPVTSDPLISAFIEIPRGSRAKFELNADTGLVVLDRFLPVGVTYPSMYGEIPQTLCGEQTRALCEKTVTALTPAGASIPIIAKGDGDPLDIMVIAQDDPGTGVPAQGGFVLAGNVRVIGVVWMVDKEEADPKIIAVMNNDPEFACVKDIAEVPERLADLVTFLATYKEPRPPCGSPLSIRTAALQAPIVGKPAAKVIIGGTSGPELAVELLRASAADYDKDIRPQLR